MTKGRKADPKLVEAVFEKAAAGLSISQTAIALNLSPGTVSGWSHRYGIKFHGTRGPRPLDQPPAPPKAAHPPSSLVAASEKRDRRRTSSRDFASPDLRREIELAKEERSTAPLYKGRVGL